MHVFHDHFATGVTGATQEEESTTEFTSYTNDTSFIGDSTTSSTGLPITPGNTNDPGTGGSNSGAFLSFTNMEIIILVAIVLFVILLCLCIICFTTRRKKKGSKNEFGFGRKSLAAHASKNRNSQHIEIVQGSPVPPQSPMSNSDGPTGGSASSINSNGIVNRGETIASDDLPNLPRDSKPAAAFQTPNYNNINSGGYNEGGITQGQQIVSTDDMRMSIASDVSSIYGSPTDNGYGNVNANANATANGYDNFNRPPPPPAQSVYSVPTPNGPPPNLPPRPGNY